MPVVRKFAKELVKAVHFLHENKLVHTDLKVSLTHSDSPD